MKYLKKFETEEEKFAWQGSSEYAKPNVVLAEGVISYNIPIMGVLIQHIDGTLYSEEGWTSGGFSNDEANGVAVITHNASFVIAKFDVGLMHWSSDSSNLVDGIMTTEYEATAKTDFAGYNNTQLMLATDTFGAGYSCANYTFPNGEKGYLPALGELNIARRNKAAIDEAMTLIGGTALGSLYWSSTQSSAIYAFVLDWNYSDTYKGDKRNSWCVRAFSSLPL